MKKSIEETMRQLGKYLYVIHLHQSDLHGSIRVVKKRTSFQGLVQVLQHLEFYKKPDKEILEFYKDLLRDKEIELTRTSASPCTARNITR